MVIWMIYAAAVAGLFACGALALDRLCERAGRPRRFAWLAGLTLALLVPLTAAPPERRPNAPPPTPPEATSAPVALPASAPDGHPSPSLPPTAGPRPPDAGPHPAARTALAAWGLASLALATLMGAVLVGAAVARRRWERRRVAGEDVYVSRRFGPALVGVARPAIVLPRWVLRLGAVARATVVGHEREHARAGDHLVLLYGGLLVAALPWNPAVWWMFLRLRAAVEIDCDRRVLASGVPFADYGDLLLAVGARRSGRPFYALTMAGSRSMLERRLKAMNTNDAARKARKSTLALLGCAALAAAVVACGVQPPTGIAPAIDEALAAPEGEEARREEARQAEQVRREEARRVEQTPLEAATDEDGHLHVRGIHGSPKLVLSAELVALDPVVLVDDVVLDGGLAALLAGEPLDLKTVAYTREPNVFPELGDRASRGVVILRTVANSREARRVEEARREAARRAEQTPLQAATDEDGRLHVRGVDGSPKLVLSAESVALDPVVLVDDVVLDGGLAALLADEPLDIKMIGYTRKPHVFPELGDRAARGVVFLRTAAKPREEARQLEDSRREFNTVVGQLQTARASTTAGLNQEVEGLARQLEGHRRRMEAFGRQLQDRARDMSAIARRLQQLAERERAAERRGGSGRNR